ncbi:hypothetical protein BH721_06890 [Clostridium baratii]|uniref:DUF4363 family protein n=1 Tax=Clostridium baratii TaxID=1561 RepID=A0A174U6A0_9CLOT|nr:DUF4363 family protein [Clostridium baratii]OPF50792.1 hypothetical protein A1M12_08120 [Clostridium baratii]OPF54590.1 hypothetical protein BH721_06890 [Clostridium baratii]OPF54896.1 hypothetical protein BH724_01650 [Clostridium baratii]OPF59101.1 hypothetical protein BH725_10795 [Clostridium baratii]CUQ18114.1 Uncharacterised protein [Clostridium baratii]
MKNTIVSIILFITVIGFVSFAHNELIDLCDAINMDSERIEELINEDNWDKAYEESVSLLSKLKDESLVSSMYINHVELDQLVDNTVLVTVNVKCKSKNDALASLHVVKYNSNRIKEMQNPKLRNIL